MALIKSLERQQKEKNSRHARTIAKYCVFDTSDGDRIFQIDTFGSDERQIPGKVSQSIQINRKMAKELMAILRSEFNL